MVNSIQYKCALTRFTFHTNRQNDDRHTKHYNNKNTDDSLGLLMFEKRPTLR